MKAQRIGTISGKSFFVLADISGWNSSKRMARLPLFLKGDAFKVFSKLPESLKADESQLPGVMRRSFSFSFLFSVSPGTAFKSFKERKMRVDEMPDVFVADLRRLLELAGHVPTDDDRDPVLLEQFLHGLPADFEKELRLSSAGQSMKISACVEKVRALSACTARRSGGGFVAATASAHGRSRVDKKFRAILRGGRGGRPSLCMCFKAFRCAAEKRGGSI